MMVTLSCESVQPPLSKVHLKTFAPTPNPVIPEVAEVGVVIVPEPLTKDQVPPPDAGILPANVAVVAQTV